MSDLWRDARAFKRDMRANWHDCPNCVYGDNARKVAPGCTCWECGWEAPGRKGDDISKAREAEAVRFASELAEEDERKKRRALRTCDVCRHVFPNKESMQKHRSVMHKRRLAKLAQTAQ